MTPSVPRPTILVVEDKRELREVLRRTLTENNYLVLTADDGETGLEAALGQHPDLVILDVGLPGRDGLEVARELRARGFRAPVLMLTAHNAIPDRVAGFDAGADDYLGKPFNYDELLARVRALLRRSRAEANVIRFADLALDPITRQVSRAGRPVPLTQREYALLEYFLRKAGRIVTREQISQDVWQVPFDPENNIIDVYVSYLRGKLEANGERPLLHTVRRVGYVLRDGDEPIGK
ncbi:MAG TPA: response regulator transcription factor [Gemmatimonadaceae bacterium]|nr:response regulator transcription factor [Gemmatimonadaceae bacterium]